jgi:cell division septation protein DedD
MCYQKGPVSTPRHRPRYTDHAESCPPVARSSKACGQERGTHFGALPRAPWGEADRCLTAILAQRFGRATFAPEPDSSPRRRAEGIAVPRFKLGNNLGGHHRADADRHRIPSHVAPSSRRISKRWRLLPLAAIAPVLIGSVAMASTGGTINHKVASTVTVQALSLDVPAPAVGQTVTATAKVVAVRQLTLDDVVLAVRDQSGRNFDFPGTANWAVGTTQKAYRSARQFNAPGTYTYWFAYRNGGGWINLSPRHTFTVVSGGATPTTSPSTSPSAAPTPTPTSPSPSPSSTSTSTSTPTATSSPSPTATVTTAPPTNSSPIPVGIGGTWSYKFGDDFAGPLAWGSKWADSSTAEADGGHGNTGNQQLEWNQAANCSTSNGILSMTAKPASITSPSGKHYNWSSCLLSTSPSYAFHYGYMEIRAELPAPTGFWPAFWTWQAAGNNQWTETDTYEFYSDNHSRLYLTQHSGAGGGTVYSPAFDPTTGFHTYGVDIEPDGTHFYVDGKLVYTTAATSTGMTNIILDNFVYANVPPAPGTSASMLVDYVRAWQH